jgi:hypothetical protein
MQKKGIIMLQDQLETYMKIIAMETPMFPSIKECALTKSSITNKHFIKATTKQDRIFGISYVFGTSAYEIWSSVGEFRDFEDQLHISFDSLTSLLLFLNKADMDEVLIKMTPELDANK